MTTELLVYAIALAGMWLVAMRLRSASARQWLYLIASLIFYYSWAGWLIVFLLFSALMNYGLGEWLKKNITSQRLWTAVGINLIFLAVFKYLPPLGAAAPAGSSLAFLRRMVFPIGISFWTFQALSYLFELYREEDLDPTPVEFCLYMAFWPTVLQGPICRMSSMLPQFRQSWNVQAEDLNVGVRRVGTGLLMSGLALVMSGGLHAGAGVDAAFDRTSAHLGGLDAWCLLLGYAFQLYFSFCGLSHICIGAARLFGIQLHENFDRPYLSTTPAIFWTRWHMSLSFWIRDFVFLPLATMRREVWWRNLSLVIAFFIFGLWHGGTWLYMMWGVYHGMVLVLHRQWVEIRKRTGLEWSGAVPTVISWGVTFTAVLIGYVFFRAETVPQALGMLRAIATLHSYRHPTLDKSLYLMTFLAAAGYFAVVAGAALLDRLEKFVCRDDGRRSWWRVLLSAFVQERWVWIAPIVVVLTLYLSVIFQPGHAQTGPVMYGLF
jgi:D-alanyl-lipoteichoic acid acyltransferase DltB (MBOAT superfamily)